MQEDENSPGPSRKRPADGILADTPNRPRPGTKISPRKAYFTKVVNYNVKDKKQLNFDIKLARLLVSLNCAFTGLASAEAKKFADEILAKYHMHYEPDYLYRYMF